MKEMYEGDLYAEKNPTWHEEDAPWKAGHIERMIRKNRVPHGTICEVGCGTGEILLNLEKAFPAAVQKQTPNTQFQLKDLLAKTGAHYDLVLAIDVIEHVEDYISFIKKLKAFGTYKIFHIPLDVSVQSIFRAWPIEELRRNVGHLHYFFKQTAIATLEDCGYTIIDHCYTASRLELPNQAASSRLVRIPRRMLFALDEDFAVRLLGGYSLLVLAK
jgi:hypothetical protein